MSALVAGTLAVLIGTGLAAPARAGTESAAGFENAQGGHGDDFLAGDAGPNRLVGDNGNDTLDGGPSTDY